MTAPSALAFRDPKRGFALRARLDAAVKSAGRRVTVMHVCGSHEQAIARFGLRATFPEALDVRMGPGCPVCVTDTADVDSAIAIAKSGVRVLTYGDMLRFAAGLIRRIARIEREMARHSFTVIRKQTASSVACGCQ